MTAGVVFVVGVVDIVGDVDRDGRGANLQQMTRLDVGLVVLGFQPDIGGPEHSVFAG